MPITDGIIRKREEVRLKGNACNIVRKLYDQNVLDDTYIEKISYLSDGLMVRGYIARPKAEGIYPVLIWNRGGYGDKGAISDLTAYLILASTAIHGYVVLGSQYRGNRQSEGIEDWGGCDLNDALNMAKVAENLPECDLNRMAIEGPSRGGMNTYRALAQKHSFRCAIIHAGITDINNLLEIKPDFHKIVDRHLGKLSDDEKREKIKNLSAVHLAENFSKECPILIMHGDKDTVIPIEQSEMLVDKLIENNIPQKYIRIKNGTHVALKDGSYKEIDQYRFEWLGKYLKKS